MTAMLGPRDSSPSSDPGDLTAIDDAAARWVARRDRGLDAAQQDEFLAWLAADPRHGERFARHLRGWSELAQLAQWRPEHGALPNADLLAPPARGLRPRSRRVLLFLVPLSLAAALAVALLVRPSALPPAAPVAIETGYHRELLDDGTVAEFNHGARLVVEFTPAVRHERVTRGEVLFTVAKNPARPFVVEAGGVTVRAVGTAFNVRLGSATVEVLVTEGRVQVDRPAAPLVSPALVSAGERTVMPRSAGAPLTGPVTQSEIDRDLAWQPRLLEFSATPLSEVAAEFNRHNRVQLIVAEETLGALPIGTSFRSDNVDGFVRLLEATFGIAAERSADTITLRRAR